MTKEERLKLYSLDDTMGAGGIINRVIPEEEWAVIRKMIEKSRQQYYANHNKNKVEKQMTFA